MTTKAREPESGESKRPKLIDLSKTDPGLIRTLIDAYEKGVSVRGSKWGVVVQLRILASDIRALATYHPDTIPEALLRAAREVDWNLVDRYGKILNAPSEAEVEQRGPCKLVGAVRDLGDLAPLYASLNKSDPDWEAKTRALFTKKDSPR